jgi:TRAP-type mannitol/chloroaromatic compound transport system substrate-binding protein
MCGNTGVQMGGWFNKKIRSPNDFKGLKMRMPGLGGQVIGKLGASPVSLPGGQIYENLVSGAIDATEWVGPWNDEAMKFQEAAKYYYYPGMHEPGSMLTCGTNKSWFTSLSKSDQTLIEAAASTENDVMMSEYNAKNGAALKRLINDNGVKLEKFNDKVYDAFAVAAEEVFAEVQASSDLASRTHASFLKARKEIGSWTNLSDSPYIQQRNRALGVK